MNILIVEDDIRTASFIQKALEQDGFNVEHAADGKAGLQSLQSKTFDLAVMDIMMPKLDGLSVIRRVRQDQSKPPILVLTAKDTEHDRVESLEAGADAYMTKPFAFSELLDRIHSLIGTAMASGETTKLALGDLKIDLSEKTVFRGERKIELDPKEFDLLVYLVRNAGRLVSKAMILENVWNYTIDVQVKIVDLRIHYLQQKVDAFSEPKLIHSIPGAGYVIRESSS